MHADDVEERLAIAVEAGASGAGDLRFVLGEVFVGELGGSRKRLAEFGDLAKDRSLRAAFESFDFEDDA